MAAILISTALLPGLLYSQSDLPVNSMEDYSLSNDLYFGNTRILSPVFILSGGIAVSVPGNGLKLLAPANVVTWTGGFLSLIVNM